MIYLLTGNLSNPVKANVCFLKPLKTLDSTEKKTLGCTERRHWPKVS